MTSSIRESTINYPNHSNSESLLQSLSAFTQLAPSQILSIVGDDEFGAAARSLRVCTPDKMDNISRLLLGPVLAKIPAGIRMNITSLLKKIRNPTKELACVDPLSGGGNRLLTSLKPHVRSNFYGSGKRFAFGLSHDVDTRIGYGFVPKMAEDLTARGLTSSFYFLTHADYHVDHGLVRELLEGGFEIGLHGKNHDIGIGMRNREYIRSWLEAAKYRLGLDKPGFRSPGLSVSTVLMEELENAGFLYDSSLQYGSSFYESTEYSLPFRLAGCRLPEIPIWFQDAFLFRDAALSSEKALIWCQDMVARLSSIGAVVVLLLHPDIMVHQQRFWRDFLDYLAELANKDALVRPLDRLIGLFDKQFTNQMECSIENTWN